MSDKKISQLNPAATPLAGTEVLPIVQSGNTVKVSVDNLTAGKAVSASSLTLSGGTADGVLYLNGSKVASSGTALAFAGTNLTTGSTNGVSVGRAFTSNAGNLQVGGTANTGLFTQEGADVVRVGVRASGRTGIAFDSSNATYTNRMWYIDNVGANGTLGIGRPGLDAMTFANDGNVTINSNNIVIGTAAKGIDFSANTGAAGETSSLLNWYEEGTWTPSVRGETGGAWAGQTGTFSGKYTRIGRMVTCNFSIALTATGSVAGNYAVIAGLPFTVGSPSGNAIISYWGPLTSNWTNIVGLAASSIIYLYGRKTAGTSQDVVFVSEITATTELVGTAIYFV